jgi:hypothetical protein
MKHLILFLTLPLSLLAFVSFAKGHGGGHGGHGGGHGGGHSAGSSGGTGAGRGSGTHSSQSRSAGHNSTARGINPGTTSRTRTLPGGYRGPARTHTFVPGRYGVTSGGGYTGGGGYYREPPYPYGYYNPYGPYGPYFYDPYFNMFSLGMNFMYTPHYYVGPDNNNANNSTSNHPEEEGMDGFVVYEHDTISGAVTIKNNAILVETADTARGYDYKFRIKKPGLDYVTVYNDDNKQINLVRLKDEPKTLYRVIHEGKLNIYDERHDFIYRPEDVDARTLIVVYNGEIVHLHGHSPEREKQRLVAFVNKAYGTDLDPQKYNWKQLLIYIDKLD